MHIKGDSLKEIKDELITRHVPNDVIEVNLNYSVALNKLEREIRDWISQGYTISQVKSHLIELIFRKSKTFTLSPRFLCSPSSVFLLSLHLPFSQQCCPWMKSFF